MKTHSRQQQYLVPHCGVRHWLPTVSIFIVFLALLGCDSRVWLSPQQQTALESRLTSAGINAKYETLICSSDRGQGFILAVDSPLSDSELRLLKTTVESYLSENWIPTFKWVAVSTKQRNGITHAVDLNARVPPQPSSSASTQTSRQSLPASMPCAEFQHFSGGGIEFDLPQSLVVPSKAEFDPDRVRRNYELQGIDFILFRRSNDGTVSLLVTRSKKSTTHDQLYKEKRQLAEEIQRGGVTLYGDRFVKFTVEPTSLSSNLQALIEYGEKSNGEAAVTYEFLSSGYDFALIFIYKTKSAAERDRVTRDKVVSSLRITAAKQ
jgi:hypothetical protein